MRTHRDIDNFMEDNPCNVCGNWREMHTSWTTINPGRRFVSCPNDSCKDFAWFDPPMCARSVQIIPRLLKKANKMEAEITRLKAREKKLYVALAMTWVAIAIVGLPLPLSCCRKCRASAYVVGL